MIRLLAGDCRDVLAPLPADSVHTVVTSPPYYNLRDYGTAQWDGGDAACDHAQKRSMGATTLRLDGREHLGAYDGEKATRIGTPYRASCGKCGAVRVDRQIGVEPTPDEYLATMVGVFREVRRVLRPDGTCWVNMGDSYSGGGTLGRNDAGRNFTGGGGNKLGSGNPGNGLSVSRGTKPKDLLMMPARLALALQADGWWVRSDIIWHKPNPMPESVTDRPTSAHEHVFLLTKSARYFYDADAVREEHARLWDGTNGGNMSPDGMHKANGEYRERGGAYPLPHPGGRNLRNVWTIATAPYSEAHFATFPPALAERCIKAGTSERGCCSQCGKPWVRVTTSKLVPQYESRHGGFAARGDTTGMVDMSKSWTPGTKETTTTGWRAGCECESLRCVSCSHALETRNASTKHTMPDMRQSRRAVGEHAPEEVLRLALLQGVDAAENRQASGRQAVSDVRRDLQAVEPPERLLQSSMLRQPREEAKADTVPSMREGVHANKLPSEAVLEAMRGSMGSNQQSFDEGLDDNQHRLQIDLEEGPSERERLRLRSGTSTGNGEEAREASDIGRGGSSQEWRQAGQSDQQSGTDGEASARRASKAGLSCDVPALSDGVPDARPCPHCGSDTEWATPTTSPCVVLDCFAGAGTTLLCTDRLQRDAIGVELNVEYTRMAMQRCRDDAPLFADIPPVADPEDERMADLFAEAAE